MQSSIEKRTDNFLFEGFDPSQDLRSYCKDIYTLIEGDSPSESSKQACICKSTTGYKGTVKVVFASGSFVVESLDKELTTMLDKLKIQFLLQVSSWRQTRNTERTL